MRSFGGQDLHASRVDGSPVGGVEFSLRRFVFDPFGLICQSAAEFWVFEEAVLGEMSRYALFNAFRIGAGVFWCS